MKKLAFLFVFTLSIFAQAQQVEYYAPDSSYLWRGDYSSQWLLQIKDSSHATAPAPHFSSDQEDYVRIWADNFWIKRAAYQYRINTPVSILWADSSGYVHSANATLFAMTNGTYSNPSWITSLAWAKITGAPQSVRAQTDVSGSYTWTFPVPYATGVTPVVTCTTEGSASYIWTQQIVSISNTSVTVQITKSQDTTLSSVHVMAIQPNPQAYVHLVAMNP